MTIRTLLLVTDGSEEATRADDMAIEIARLAGARVVVMCSFQGPFGVRKRGAALVEELRRGIEEDAAEILQEVAGRIQQAGLQVSAQAMEGTPAETIQQAVEECSPDLVVLGAGRTGGLPGLLWGSVAEVVRVCTAPVLVVK